MKILCLSLLLATVAYPQDPIAIESITDHTELPAHQFYSNNPPTGFTETLTVPGGSKFVVVTGQYPERARVRLDSIILETKDGSKSYPVGCISETGEPFLLDRNYGRPVTGKMTPIFLVENTKVPAKITIGEISVELPAPSKKIPSFQPELPNFKVTGVRTSDSLETPYKMTPADKSARDGAIVGFTKAYFPMEGETILFVEIEKSGDLEVKFNELALFANGAFTSTLIGVISRDRFRDFGTIRIKGKLILIFAAPSDAQSLDLRYRQVKVLDIPLPPAE